MGGIGWGPRTAAALLGAVALTSAAAADPIPLPRPAPLPKEGAAPAAPARAAAQPAEPGLISGLKSLFNLDRPGDTAALALSGFTAAQRAQVDKVSAYLSRVQQLRGKFVQVGPDGSRVTGEFYIQKPGRIRFEYDPPSPIEVVADGSFVQVRDRKLETKDTYPLATTPLRYLLADRIDLWRETHLVSVGQDAKYITVTIEEKSLVVGTHRLMMMFDAKDFQLLQWTVTDPQGYDTTVAIYNLDSTKKVDPGLFKIDFTNYNTPPG